jgi:hypothetical protein
LCCPPAWASPQTCPPERHQLGSCCPLLSLLPSPGRRHPRHRASPVRQYEQGLCRCIGHRDPCLPHFHPGGGGRATCGNFLRLATGHGLSASGTACRLGAPARALRSQRMTPPKTTDTGPFCRLVFPGPSAKLSTPPRNVLSGISPPQNNLPQQTSSGGASGLEPTGPAGRE